MDVTKNWWEPIESRWPAEHQIVHLAIGHASQDDIPTGAPSTCLTVSLQTLAPRMLLKTDDVHLLIAFGKEGDKVKGTRVVEQGADLIASLDGMWSILQLSPLRHEERLVGDFIGDSSATT